MVSRFIDMTYHSSFDQCNVGNVGHTCTLAVKMFGPGSLFNKLKNYSRIFQQLPHQIVAYLIGKWHFFIKKNLLDQRTF